ncbi:MAG: hypothetical protein ACK5KP_10425 [Paludibacteraceae bacterium]
MRTSHQKAFNYRAFISVGLFFALIILFVTAVLIQFFEEDPDSLEMHISVSCHALAGIIFIILNIIHLRLNWQAFKSYTKNKEGNVNREITLAILSVVLFIVIGTFIVYLLVGG